MLMHALVDLWLRLSFSSCRVTQLNFGLFEEASRSKIPEGNLRQLEPTAFVAQLIECLISCSNVRLDRLSASPTQNENVFRTIKTLFAPPMQATNADRDHNRSRENKTWAKRNYATKFSSASVVGLRKTSRFRWKSQKIDLWCGNSRLGMEIYSNCTHKLVAICNRDENFRFGIELRSFASSHSSLSREHRNCI